MCVSTLRLAPGATEYPYLDLLVLTLTLHIVALGGFLVDQLGFDSINPGLGRIASAAATWSKNKSSQRRGARKQCVPWPVMCTRTVIAILERVVRIYKILLKYFNFGLVIVCGIFVLVDFDGERGDGGSSGCIVRREVCVKLVCFVLVILDR